MSDTNRVSPANIYKGVLFLMKAILIAVKPYYCSEILNRRKSIEIRTRIPKIDPPYKCYLYCTNSAPYLVFADVFRGDWVTEYTITYGYSRTEAEKLWGVMNGKVIGEFICDYTESYKSFLPDKSATLRHIKLNARVEYNDIISYFGEDLEGYGLHISKVIPYDDGELKELNYFGLRRPPQSWCYVEEMQ
jgi:predicted transcriptional regulator